MPARTLRTILILGMLLSSIALLGGVDLRGHEVQAQAQTAQLCYTVADDGDALWQVNPSTGSSSLIGELGGSYTSVEAIAISLDAETLYGVHDDDDRGVFGTINTTTGAFTEIGPVGPGDGVSIFTGNPITNDLNDIDSLSTHPLTGDMWAVTHVTRANRIFRINVDTGAIVPDTFGPGLDFVQ